MTRQIFVITLNVKDVTTRIELTPFLWVGPARSAQSAERKALRAQKNSVLRHWSYETCDKYRLTAMQLNRLVADGLITPPDLYEVTVTNVESEPYFPPQRGEKTDGFEPFGWD